MNTVFLDPKTVCSGPLVLVNAHHPIREPEKPDLCCVDARFPHVRLERTAAHALQGIVRALAQGEAILPVSGYRSHSAQEAIYDGSVRERGAQFARKYVALPGCSEHQTGLAVDLGILGEEIDALCPAFPNEGIGAAFRALAPRYGFIERYERKKEHITGIACEPWHFRYVGNPHSQIIAQNGFSLEEYIDGIKSYRKTCPWTDPCAPEAEVFYVPMQGNGVTLSLPCGRPWQASGNNVDGWILTVWRTCNG